MSSCLIELSYSFDDYNNLRLLKGKDCIKGRNTNMRKMSLEMWELTTWNFLLYLFIFLDMFLLW